jgi:pimeloyl-ACP methyl ester carboxylesterase
MIFKYEDIEMPTIRINKTNYYYELHGSGDPVVLINGLKADHTGWIPVLDTLQKNHTVLTFDNLGAGQTVDDDEKFDIDRMADETMELVRQLGLSAPHIVGHSLGGAVAQSIAYRYADEIRSVALCNTFIKFNENAKQLFLDVLDMHKAGDSQANIMSAILPWAFSEEFMSPELEEIILKGSNENPFPQSPRGYERQLEALYTFNADSWVNHINIPTLVVAAKKDKIALFSESEEIAGRIRNARLASLDAGHASQVERPAEFISALLAFYSELSCNLRMN